MVVRLLTATLVLAGLALACVSTADEPSRYFVVEVVDDATGRGVPLVELQTTNAVSYYTDSAGIAIIDEPSLIGQRVHFAVRSHGYEGPADGFGIRGTVVTIEPGKSAQVKVRRVNIAERLYRLTGEGIYRDSLRAGRRAPTRHPLLNAQVMGSDSVQNAVYQGKLFWMWGDTSRPSYPLGNFHMSGATTALPEQGGLDPAIGVDLDYFTDSNGFAREMAPISGKGPTWLGGLVALPEAGRERLFAAYVKIRPPLEAYERGLCRFNDEKGQFERLNTIPMSAPVYPDGHPVKRRENGRDYVYFGDPFPLVRTSATGEGYRDLTQYEAYTPLQEGSRLDEPRLDRDADGKLRYQWRRNTPAVNPEAQEVLIRKRLMKREEALLSLVDPVSGKPVVIHRGTVNWNAYRKRWIMIATEIGGTSQLGEVWFAESERPEGPWQNPRKIVTHERYSFYNPAQHPEFDQQGGRVIYFEGTYTHSFSGNTAQTPRYDYNQMMYRLDLADPRLAPSLNPGKVQMGG